MFLLETTNLKAHNTGLQDKLKSGSFVVFTVGKKIDTNLFRIALYGKTMSVRSTKFLTEGSRMRARVSWVENRLQLNVSGKESDSLTDLLLRSSITIKSETRMIAEALIRSGMPLLPEYFEKIQGNLKKYKNADEKLVKILLLLIDKGIPLNGQNITEILSFSDRHEKKHSESREKGEKAKTDKKIEEIKADIKKQIKHTDSGNELLKYFNHKIALHDNWLIIPLNYSFKRKGMGVLKLRMDEKFFVTNLVLTLSDGRDWEFNLVKNKNSGNMKVWGPGDLHWENTAAFRKLKEKLHNIGIQFDDINIGLPSADGFMEIVPGKYDSIDFTV